MNTVATITALAKDQRQAQFAFRFDFSRRRTRRSTKDVGLLGFNDDFTGAATDIGSFETGPPPLRFGREMAPGFTRAPWER